MRLPGSLSFVTYLTKNRLSYFSQDVVLASSFSKKVKHICIFASSTRLVIAKRDHHVQRSQLYTWNFTDIACIQVSGPCVSFFWQQVNKRSAVGCHDSIQTNDKLRLWGIDTQFTNLLCLFFLSFTLLTSEHWLIV